MSLAALSLRMHTAGGALRFAAATSSCSAAHIRADAAARRFVRATSPCRCMATFRGASRPPPAARAPLVRCFAGVDSAATAAAPVVAAVAPQPRVYSGLQMLEQLQELRSRNAPAAEQAAVAAQFGGSAWSLDALHEYLEPGEAAPRAADALRAFEAATQQLGVQPTAATFALLIRRLCAEWSAEQAIRLDLLCAKFSKCNPPLQFNKLQIASLVSAALPHPEATLHLRQWAAVDHPRNAREWEQIQRTLRRVARATTPRAEPSVVAAEPHSHTLTVTPAKAGAASAAAAQRSLTDALLSLLEEARHCADPSSPSASAGVEAAAAAASDGAWCRDALVAYLRCYTQLPGAEAALRTFRRVTDDLGLQPSAPLYGLMFRCLAVDWRPEHAAIMDQLRAVMLSQRPPLRFGELLITSMAPSLSTRSQTAERLQRWAEEDGAWDNLDHKVKRRIRSVALGAPPPPSTSGPPPPQPALRRRISELAEAGDFDAAGRLVAEAEAAGTSIDVKIMTAWLSCHERSGEWRGAEKVWRRMAELGLAPSAVSYRALIQVFTVNGETEQLAKIEPLYAEMTSGSGPAGAPLQFSARDFEQLIKTAHRCRLAAEVRRWAERAKAAGVWEQLDEASRRIVARAIEWEQQPRPVPQEEQQSALRNRLIALTAAGDWTQAERLVAEAEAVGTQIDVKIINAWLACYSRSGEWHGAGRVWQRMAELSLAPDAASYCALMRAYTVNGEAEQLAKIEPLYTEMITGSGPAGAALQFSARDFGQLIKAAHRRRLVDQVLRWAERAKASGAWEQLDEASRHFATTAADKAENARAALREQQQSALRTGLVELAKAGDWAGAERLIAEAEASGTQINARIATSWLACYGRSGEWRGAEKVWRRMAELGLAPTSASHCALMRVYMHSGEAEQLAKIEPLFAEMSNGSGPAGAPLQFSVGDFERLIKTAHHCRLAAEARKWADRTRAAGMCEKLDEVSRHIVATVAEWDQQPRPAQQEEQQSALRNRLIALTAAGDWTQAGQAVADFEAAGGQLDVKTATAWLSCHERSGEWRGAEAVWRRMAELNIAPTAVSYRRIMQVYTASGEADQMDKIEPLYVEMTSGSGSSGAPLHFSARHFEQLIKTAHRRRLAAEVRKWAERAKAAGVWEQLDEMTRHFATTAADIAENARAVLREKQQIALVRGLVELAKAGDWAGAERLIAEAEASGTQINTRIATVWLACYTRNGEWRGAEAVWRRMAELAVAPGALSYCALMQVYMHSGEADQLAKIEPLYTEMTSGSGPAGQPLQLAARDLEQMIKTARRCRLAAEARRWAERAKAAGLWEQLDKAIRRIVSTANHWGEDISAALREEQESAPAIDTASLLQRGSQEQSARDDQHGKSDRDAPASAPTAAPASGRDARRSINALQTLVRRGVPLWGGETPAEMSAKIESIVHRLVKHSCQDGSDLTWAEWQAVLRAVLKHKLRGFALPLYIAMRLQQEEMVQRAARSSSSSPRQAPTPAKLRMPTACMRMLLQIALHSSVSQNAELHLGTASRAAINRFLASCPAPPPHVSAAGSHRLALWMLEDMRTRGVVATGGRGKEGVWSDRFDWSSAEPVNVVLAALCKRGGGIFAVADRMRSARELFSAMVVRDGTSYELFHEALRANGEHLTASEVDKMLLADRSRTSPACVALRLSKLRSQTTAPRERMLLQAEELWSELVDNPQQLLGVAATRAMLQLLQHCGADAARMHAVVEQALQLEEQVGAERQEAANPEGKMSDWEMFYAAPAPVAVDSACFELLLHSFATSAQPSAFAAEASAAYDNLLRRYAVAVACNAYRRAALLTPSASARCAFLHYLHRAGLYTQLVTAWRSLTTEQQHACADQVTAILLDLDQSGQPAEAEALSSRLQGQEEMPSTLEESQRSE